MNSSAASLCGLCLALAVSACQAPAPLPAGHSTSLAGPASPPNILLILADDLGYSDLGYNGSEIPTPNIDALAGAGMLLTNFHAGMTCSPTRAMLMSGTDSHVSGLGVMTAPTRPEHMGRPGYLGHLNFEVASLADLLADAGYDTYITGKWHLGEEVETGPAARGFSRAFVSLDGAAHLGPWDWRGPQAAKYRDGEALVEVGEDFYSTRDYTERMLGFIEQDRARGRPFFAFLAYTAPHWPLQAPPEAIERFRGWYDEGYEAIYARRLAALVDRGLAPDGLAPPDGAVFTPRWAEQPPQERALAARRMEVYAAMVSELDHFIGRVVDYLKASGEYDNTLIVFLSDNGAEHMRRDLMPPIAEHVGREYDHSLDNLGAASSYVMYGPNWAAVSAAPFRGHKFTGYEGGIRVPAFVHAPGRVAAGSRSDAFATVMDLLPTFVELAGGTLPDGSYRGRPVARVQGRSLLPLLSGQADSVHAHGALFGWELWGQRSVREGDWKIVWDAAEGDAARWRLFDIVRDPAERNDLAQAMPGRLDAMAAAWDRYAQENGVIWFNGR